MYKLNLKPLLFVLLSTVIISSCKKDKLDSPTTQPVAEVAPTPTTNRSEQIKDSIFLYAKQVYFWYKDLPTYQDFNPRKFTGSSELASYESELFAITRYPINAATGKSYEYLTAAPQYPKFSYIEDLVESGKIAFKPQTQASVDLSGKGNDFGLSFAYLAVDNTSIPYNIYIRYTSPGSPAKSKGLERGDKVETINGISYGTNFNNEINSVVNSLNANSITITGKKKNGESFNISLNKATYTSSPIYKDTVLTVGAKKVGYMAYARFSSTDNSSSEFSRIFNKFSNQGVTDLVIDLRYNGGGYVSTAEELVNYIIPSSQNGKKMFVEYYNDLMQSGKATILKNQKVYNQNGDPIVGRTYDDYSYSEASNTTLINKKGPLTSISKVVFITGGGTASASELTINSLKPYMDVKIVGKKSYGKPVGFFPIRIGKYDIYYSMFETRNSANSGGYYDGFTPDSDKPDDVTRDFGDRSELSLAAALAYISNGSFSTSSTSSVATMSIEGKTKTVSSYPEVRGNNEEGFVGMIGSPRKLK